jgi:hypothetical protein
MNPTNYFGNGPLGFIEIVAFVVIFFFLVREVLVWYWKINKIVSLLEKIEENTRDKKVI